MAQGTFFKLGSAEPTAALRNLLRALSIELGKLPNNISIEGHTDSMVYVVRRGYDNWDLSTDRANEARRLMVAQGIRTEQIAQVRGFADREPRQGLKPQDPLNRRISIIVQYLVADASEMPLPSSVTSQNASPPSGEPRPTAPARGQPGQ